MTGLDRVISHDPEEMLAVAEAGQYRVFADFQPAGRDRALTLGVDVPAAVEEHETRAVQVCEGSHEARRGPAGTEEAAKLAQAIATAMIK